MAAVVRFLRTEGYERVVLVGNSGGGGLAALYQEQARTPSISSAPGGGGPDLTQADLPPVDALVMLMAHPGRATLLTEWLDPAVRGEDDPFDRDPALSQWSVRLSNGDGPTRLRHVDVPVHVIYGTSDQGCFPSHAHTLYSAVPHDTKTLTPIRGGKHYLNDQPDLVASMATVLVSWVRQVL